MINTVSDMLLDLKKKEEEAIDKFQKEVVNLNHPTIIGDMYEGTAEKILNKTIFKGLDLKIVSGQIINKDRKKSAQVDCMIVEGEGNQIPNTNEWIYDISQVIAVFEVKKNLHKADLVDSYNKMLKINDIFDPVDMTENEYSLFRDSFRSAVGMEVPDHKDIDQYSVDIQMIYHTLLMETVMPLRIVFGFYGYKDMKNLREGFVSFLKENVTEDVNQAVKGFGPGSFPSLIFTRSSSLLKINGIPYKPSLDKNGFWDVYTSSNHNPLFHLLEILWTKLSYKHGISSDIFGEDLQIENLYRFLRSKAIVRDEKIGWEYNYIELPDDLDLDPLYIDWEPEELSEAEHLLVAWLCREESMNTKSSMFNDLLKRYNLDENEILGSLKAKRLVYKDNNNDLRLLTDQCATVTKNGKFYAGENKDGKMEKWAVK
ncbi:DUF6602 domain-containing protein [Priestia megaterium]|uniref:DUF6602 domain-containing protein n=1 Tax=Priestia megaterium TaxID=1404 RepID=UPI001C532DFE|nr:DUF6602 domain-containing protein [Priestia megaterium]MBW0931380.1 hypothetical protein [Priestia megaterium]